MKNSTLLFLLCCAVISCSKETKLPSQPSNAITEIAVPLVQPVVTFAPSAPGTVYLSQGLNTLDTDSFFVTGATAYITRFVFVLRGSVNLTAFKFYINGGQVRATITNLNDTLIVAMRKATPLAPGNYNYILQAKTTGSAGTAFGITLNSAIIVDANKFMADIRNLPKVGNDMILR